MKITITIIFAVFVTIITNCQELKIDKLNIIDSLINNLRKNGTSEIITLNMSSYWGGINDNYLLWKNVDTSYIKKINNNGIYKTKYQVNRDGSLISISNVFDYIQYKKIELLNEKVRPSGSDLIDSAVSYIYVNDTDYLIKKFSCIDCPGYSLSVYLDNIEKNYYWQSIHLEKNNEFYLENLSSDYYHIFLLIKEIIGFYEINQLWRKE
jgi:hypothetical protein